MVMRGTWAALENANLRGANPRPLDPSGAKGLPAPCIPRFKVRGYPPLKILPRIKPTHPVTTPISFSAHTMSSKEATPPTSDRKAYMEAFRARQRDAGLRRVNVSLSREEHKRLATSAKAHGEKITTHLKTLALAHLDETYLVPPDLADRLDSLLAVVRGIGNNLNQLARHSNEMRYFMDTKEVQLQLKRLDAEVRQFVSEPPRAAPAPEKRKAGEGHWMAGEDGRSGATGAGQRA